MAHTSANISKFKIIKSYLRRATHGWIFFSFRCHFQHAAGFNLSTSRHCGLLLSIQCGVIRRLTPTEGHWQQETISLRQRAIKKKSSLNKLIVKFNDFFQNANIRYCITKDTISVTHWCLVTVTCHAVDSFQVFKITFKDQNQVQNLFKSS